MRLGVGVTEEQLKRRTKRFGLSVIRWLSDLPASPAMRVLSNQLLRSATSVGANYRAACRARSVAEFVAKLGNVEEEADESAYWLELFEESGIAGGDGNQELWREADEITAIISASRKTAKRRLMSSRS